MGEEGKGSALLLRESDFAQEMEGTVEPFLRQVRKEGWLSADGGPQGIFYELYPQKDAKATIVICHGFTESSYKFHELTYYFYRSGYQVAALDHRGHGKSCRTLPGGRKKQPVDQTIVHIDRFARYVEDFRRFVQEVARPMAGEAPMYLFAHSMGGCIGAIYLEEYPDDFTKAVLNSPMMGIQTGPVPLWAAKVLCLAELAMGRGEERLLTHSPFNPNETFETSATGCKARFDWYQRYCVENPGYQTSSASYRWAWEAVRAGELARKKSQAEKVRARVLLFSAEKDGTVKAPAQRKFIRNVRNGQLVSVPDARHEIYREINPILGPWLDQVLDFWEKG